MKKTGPFKDWADTVTTSGGNIVLYPTSDKTTSGTAIYNNIYSSYITFNPLDSGNSYTFGLPVIAANKKTVTIPVNKLVASTTTVALVVGILNGLLFTAAPNGVSVRVSLLGD